MRVRQLTAILAIAAVLGTTGCSSEQGGSAVPVAGGASPLGPSPSGPSPVGPSPSAPETSAPVGEPSSSADPTGPTGPVTSLAPSPDPTTATSGPSGDPSSSGPPASTATEPSGGAGAEAVPADMCDLMPGELVKGLEKEDGNPELRCFYSGNVDKKFVAVSVSQSPFSVDPDDPAGNDSGRDVQQLTVDGRDASSWFYKSTDSASITFDVGEGSVLMSYGNEARSDEENLATVTEMATAVSKALRSGQKVAGAVEAPPSTTPATIPEGERGWPGVVCDVMPADLLQQTDPVKGYEDQSCRLRIETEDGFTNIDLYKGIAVDPEDPSGGSSDEVKQESFDGRTAYSWIEDGGQVPTAYVVFPTGERESAQIRVSIADVENPVDPEAVRSAALDLAEEVAPKLPQP